MFSVELNGKPEKKNNKNSSYIITETSMTKQRVNKISKKCSVKLSSSRL